MYSHLHYKIHYIYAVGKNKFFLKKIRFLGGSKTCQCYFEEPATRSCEKDERKEEGIISDFPANLCKCRKKNKEKKLS